MLDTAVNIWQLMLLKEQKARTGPEQNHGSAACSPGTSRTTGSCLGLSHASQQGLASWIRISATFPGSYRSIYCSCRLSSSVKPEDDVFNLHPPVFLQKPSTCPVTSKPGDGR